MIWHRAGKTYAQKIWADALLNAGKTVVFAKPSGWTKVRRVKLASGRHLDVITPLPMPDNGTEIKFVGGN